MVLHLYDSLLQGNRYHPCLWIPISHFSPSKLLVVRGWISSFIAAYSNHLPQNAAWMPVWYAYLLSQRGPNHTSHRWFITQTTGLQANQITHGSPWNIWWNGENLARKPRNETSRTNGCVEKWNYQRSIAKMSPVPQSCSHVEAFCLLMFLESDRQQELALFHTKVPWCHGLLLIRILFQLPQILRISMYLCIGVSSPSVFWPVITHIDSSSFDNIYLRFNQQKHKDTGYHKKPVNFLHFFNHRTGEDLSTNVSPRSAS